MAALIRIDTVWLATEPIDMRAGTETALARVVKVFGAAHPPHAYLFANRRANRMKVLVHDGIGIVSVQSPHLDDSGAEDADLCRRQSLYPSVMRCTAALE
jgi:hypothetical protein